jgi:hypothetical protein
VSLSLSLSFSLFLSLLLCLSLFLSLSLFAVMSVKIFAIFLRLSLKSSVPTYRIGSGLIDLALLVDQIEPENEQEISFPTKLGRLKIKNSTLEYLRRIHFDRL